MTPERVKPPRPASLIRAEMRDASRFDTEKRNRGSKSQKHSQLSLPIHSADASSAYVDPASNSKIRAKRHSVATLDQVLGTDDIVAIAGRHRCTIYRWVQSGAFPTKRVSRGKKIGWLRSEVERWLAGE